MCFKENVISDKNRIGQVNLHTDTRRNLMLFHTTLRCFILKVEQSSVEPMPSRAVELCLQLCCLHRSALAILVDKRLEIYDSYVSRRSQQIRQRQTGPMHGTAEHPMPYLHAVGIIKALWKQNGSMLCIFCSLYFFKYQNQ